MENIIGFLLDNYIYILFIAILLILALIGYLIDSNRKVPNKNSVMKEENVAPTPEVMEGAKINTTMNKVNKEEVNANNTSKEK